MLIEQKYFDAYTAKIKADYARFSANSLSITVEYEYGNKFIKVITTTWGQSGVHSFIALGANPKDTWPTGTILKAAGWRAPAQNFSRGSIFDPALPNVYWTSAR